MVELPDPHWPDYFTTVEAVAAAAEQAVGFCRTWSALPDRQPFAVAYRIASADAIRQLKDGTPVHELVPSFKIPGRSYEEPFATYLEWAWIHLIQYTQAVLMALLRYTPETETRAMEQFTTVKELMEDMHTRSIPTYDAGQEPLYERATRRWLDLVTVEAFESYDEMRRLVGEIHDKAIIGLDRPNREFNVNYECAVTLVGMLSGYADGTRLGDQMLAEKSRPTA